METILEEVRNVIPYFINHPNVWANYDKEADTLYLHFKKPSNADNSEMLDDSTIVRFENKDIVGVTIMNASKNTK